MTIMCTGKGVEVFQLLAVKSAIKLEKLGIKHSRGSVRKAWAIHFGLKPTAKADVVIEAIEKRLEELKSELQPGDIEVSGQHAQPMLLEGNNTLN